MSADCRLASCTLPDLRIGPYAVPEVSAVRYSHLQLRTGCGARTHSVPLLSANHRPRRVHIRIGASFAGPGVLRCGTAYVLGRRSGTEHRPRAPTHSHEELSTGRHAALELSTAPKSDGTHIRNYVPVAGPGVLRSGAERQTVRTSGTVCAAQAPPVDGPGSGAGALREGGADPAAPGAASGTRKERPVLLASGPARARQSCREGRGAPPTRQKR